MGTARIIYRYMTAIFIADVLLQFFLAGAGVFSAGPGTAARDSTALDPHRANGMLVTLLSDDSNFMTGQMVLVNGGMEVH